MIHITEPAKKRILELRKTEGRSAAECLRVAVRGGGCSGLLYDLSFDKDIREEDQVYETDNVKILIDKKSLFYVAGTTLDFSDGLNGKGFHFINPNATRTCGCGESFSL